MARERSPNYPSLDLEAALAAADALYRKERRSLVPLIIAAKAMGYTSLSGPVRSRISALRQYGLLEGAGEQVKLSDRAFELITSPKGTREYLAALQEAALEAPIFREMFESLRDSSDETIAYRLQREKKFSEEGARRVIRTFRATMAFAKLDEERYDDSTEADIDEVTPRPMLESINPSARSTSTSTAIRAPDQQFSFPLPGVTAQISFFGGKPNKQAWETLIQYINIAKGIALEDSLGEDEQN